MGVNGPHTQFKCLLEALIFGTCKKNIIMYSQMRFQLYQSHSLTVMGLNLLFGVLRRFQHCTGHITTGSLEGQRKPVHIVR